MTQLALCNTLGAVNAPRSRVAKMVSALRRLGGTLFYVPDNLAGVYIDSTGTTPATAVGDLVGLLTDRSYGAGNLGGQRLTNSGPFTDTAGWSSDVGLSLSAVSGALRTTSTVAGASARIARQTISGLTVGASYRVVATVGSYGGAGAQAANPSIQIRNAADTATTASIVAPALTNCTISGVFVATDTSHRIRPRWDGNASTNATSYLDWGGVSVREVLGNHATQSAVAAKPSFQRVSGRNVIQFDGNNDFLQTGITTGNEGWVCAGVAFSGAASAIETVFCSGAGAENLKGVWLARVGSLAENDFRVYVGNGTARSVTWAPGAPLRNVPRVVEGGWTASTVTAGVDGVVNTVVRAGDATPPLVSGVIGAYAGGSSAMQGPMHAIAYTSVFPSASDRATIRNGIAALQGRTL